MLNKPHTTESHIAAHARAVRSCSIAYFIPAVGLGFFDITAGMWPTILLGDVRFQIARRVARYRLKLRKPAR